MDPDVSTHILVLAFLCVSTPTEKQAAISRFLLEEEKRGKASEEWEEGIKRTKKVTAKSIEILLLTEESSTVSE